MNRDVIAINLDLLPSRPRHILQPAERGRLRCLRGSPASAPARILDAIGKSLPAKAMVMLNLADTLLPGLKRHHDLDLLSALLHGTADMCGELVRQAPTQLPQPEAVLVIQETDLLIGYSFPLPAILWSPQAMFMAIVVCIPHEPSRGVNLPLLRDQFTVIDVVESNGDNH
ncbi:hypothetical protein JW905_00575 [bacterium]|nr:hypothetical protein [candidate division CSSED10-310 bacterium]